MYRMLLMAALVWMLSLYASEAAMAQGAKDEFVGTWSLVSIRYVSPDGTAIEPLGPNAKGLLLFDGEHFSTDVIAANLPKFKSNNRMVGTLEEYAAISHGVVAYFGTYTIDDAARIVTLHIERSSFPNWEMTDQKRKFEFVGDELRYTAASSTVNPAESAQLIWKRASKLGR
jgi:Lipocalin-like domain